MMTAIKAEPARRVPQRAEPSMVNLSVGQFGLRTTRSSSARFLLLVLGIAAFFDFEFITVKKRRTQVIVETDDPLICDFLKFLNQWYVQIGICFSLLWFICAFVRAQWTRDRKLRDLDRELLLDEDVLEIKTFDHDVKAFEGAWDAYYRTVGIQLLLLPVGFYMFLWNVLRRIVNPYAVIEDGVEVDVVYIDEDGTTAVGHRFTSHSTHCLLFALLHYCAVVIKQVTGVQLEYSAVVVKKKVIRRALGFALRHPRKFVRRIRKAQTGIRWFKYLAPLIGTGNKLLGNVQDLITKYRQYLHARRARHIRKQFWKLMSEKERREAAAVRIQKCYRAMRARRAVKALQLLQGTEESIAAIRVQTAIRACLARAKTNLLLKERELDRLQK